MAKKRKIDPNQMQFNFSFEKKVDSYIEATQEIQKAIATPPVTPEPVECEFEASIEISAAIKRAIRDSGIPRKQIPDLINAYFGRSKAAADDDPPGSRNPLSIHMLNNYLSKPAEYPIPAYYLYAIHHITGSLEPAATIVAPEGGKIATGQELRQMALGKLEENISEMQKLKKQLKK
jgi:hypothetical protein